jgi:hypothetical protein
MQASRGSSACASTPWVLVDGSSRNSLIQHGIALGNVEGARVGLGKRQISERYGLLALARVVARDK